MPRSGRRERIVWDAVRRCPQTREAKNPRGRFRQHAAGHFRFITEPGVEPTNNSAQQAIRFVAIHRRMTQGTRSEGGRRWCGRIWTAIQTCRQQGRSLFEFLHAAVTAYFGCRPAPSLVPDTSQAVKAGALVAPIFRARPCRAYSSPAARRPHAVSFFQDAGEPGLLTA
ncbi:MAG TPA: hypothetical protein EYP56_21585, partial [Planctomycetaceae bacterium]|nr:hypothetical protein [Planctomycetaceae bacterium]